MSVTDGPTAHAVRERRISPLAAVSATVYGLAGVGLLLSTVFYTEGKNPRWVLGTLAVVALVFVAAALLRGRSFTVGEAEVMLLVCMSAIVILTIGSHIDVAAFSNGVGLPLLAMYAGWFLTLRGRLAYAAGALGWLVAVALRGDGLLTSIAVSIAVESLIAAEIVRLLVQRMVSLAQRDPLTGALNRNGLEHAWPRLVTAARRRNAPLSVAVIDVDGLREVNNQHGHRAGDELLVEAARQWRTQLPRPSAVGRIGGDEFVVVLPGLAGEAAEQLLASLAAVAPAPWSAGVAELSPGESLDGVVERADRLMYHRKGGNGTARTEGVRP